MENTVRLILLLIGILIILAILFDGLRKQKRKKNYLPEKLNLHEEEQLLGDRQDEEALDIEESQPRRYLFSKTESKEAEETPHYPKDEPAFEEEANTHVDHADVAEEIKTEEPLSEPHKERANPIILFSLASHTNKTLGGFKLLHSLIKQGFRFGEMNIFHYYEDDKEDSPKLFSLAAATQTGEFDMARMADFSCKGLVVFMDVNEHAHPAEIFDCMVDVSERLARELGVELKVGHDEEWTEENLAKIYETLI